jgi:hypothetical protein
VTLEHEIDETLACLRSPEALESIAADPYWPKWDSPWWRILLLVEMGRAGLVPREPLDAIARAMTTHFLPVFPFTPEEIPPGKDPVRHVLCHCALGSIDRVLAECGVDVDRALPWARAWYAKYQLADGGWNCDEAVYTRASPRSSFVSTLPVLEALLQRGGALAPRELEALDRGARYLLDRKLVRSLSKGAIAKEDWLRPMFPRFYEYDVLRGLSFVARWAELRGVRLPRESVAEAVATLEALAPTGEHAPGRRVFDGPRTGRRDASGAGVKCPAKPFPLLEAVSRVQAPNEWLAREWKATRARLASTVTGT